MRVRCRREIGAAGRQLPYLKGKPATQMSVVNSEWNGRGSERAMYFHSTYYNGISVNIENCTVSGKEFGDETTFNTLPLFQSSLKILAIPICLAVSCM